MNENFIPIHPENTLNNAPVQKPLFPDRSHYSPEQIRILDARRTLTLQQLETLWKSILNMQITPENMNDIKWQLQEMLFGPEQIYENIDLQAWDKFIWNDEVETLLVMNSENRCKFLIRLKPYTLQEQQQIDAIKPDEMPEWIENLEAWGKILWDYIQRRGAYPGKDNSCGASVGELLNSFWLRSVLPQSGRDGKNWDSILERPELSPYFAKIPVNHPDDAPAGSVLCFNEWAKLGSRSRGRHGHVEIKASNGMYYSYYASVNAGGSSRTTERDPERYKRLTGFTGYAYVYTGKPLPDRRRA